MHNIKDFDFKWAGAYEEQFNVRLFNTAVRLATETTEAHKENPALLQKLAHLPWYQRVSGMDYFESREIRYFGELLERYGEKLGDDIANTRAVALAMAWTAPILTPNMEDPVSFEEQVEYRLLAEDFMNSLSQKDRQILDVKMKGIRGKDAARAAGVGSEACVSRRFSGIRQAYYRQVKGVSANA